MKGINIKYSLYPHVAYLRQLSRGPGYGGTAEDNA